MLADLDFATGIAFGDDGTMFFTERAGRISRLAPGSSQPREIQTIVAPTGGEMGLLGIAVAPDPSDRSLYVFATDVSGDRNRVVRVPLDEGRPQLIVDDLPADEYHNGGGVVFDDDGTLLISNGETHESERAQDPNALGGKVYRFNPDGSVPQDNPFGDSPTYALGLRNPFGIGLDPVSGAPFVTENGPSSNDEVNRIVPGGNYGWPSLLGTVGEAAGADLLGRYQDPFLDYPEIIVPTGIAFADPDGARRRFAGDMFFAAFGERTIHHVELDEARRKAVSDEVIVNEKEGIVGVAWGPRGLYYSTPTAIKVLPLARASSPRADDEGPTADPSPTASPSRAPAPAGSGIWGLLVLALLALGAVVTTRRLRR